MRTWPAFAAAAVLLLGLGWLAVRDPARDPAPAPAERVCPTELQLPAGPLRFNVC